ncbi:glycosyltransferase family 2 protein [Buttiauxella gaviniae]|uniref:glycosyltransferase family 2 protein n=1 Tax=Buttiauxella gaviniae TaxID=82990 RepID=UPI003BB5F66F
MIVDIVMATYNGVLFIEEQIESIQNQTFKNWRLLISDDGSSDKTIELIRKKIECDKRIILVNTERQGGVVKNFERALKETNANLIAFCDQDDIWPLDRLQILINKYFELSNNQSIPFLIYTDLELIDARGELLNESFYKSNRIDPLDNLKSNNLMWFSSVYGCTILVNRELLKISLPFPKDIPMHDHWLALKAMHANGLYYYDYKSVKYRQHELNVVGGRSKTFYEKIKVLPKNIKNIFSTVTKVKQMQFSINNKVSSIAEDFIFARKYIMPKIFKGNNKIYCLLFLVMFILK